MVIFEKLSNGIFKIEKLLVIVLVLAMFISLTLGVIFRYYFNKPITGSDEIAIFSLIWVTFIGGSMSIKRQQSAAVAVLVDRVSGRLRSILISMGVAFLIIFVFYMVQISVTWILAPNILLQRSNSLQIPMIIPYLSVPVGFAFMSIHALNLFVQSIKAASERGQ